MIAVVKADRAAGDPVLITEAAQSFDDQHAARKRRYLIMMGLRLPCLILAGVFYETWWLALGLVLLSVPLPWVAVLIANDRPPRKAEQVNRYQHDARQIEAANPAKPSGGPGGRPPGDVTVHKVIDG